MSSFGNPISLFSYLIPHNSSTLPIWTFKFHIFILCSVFKNKETEEEWRRWEELDHVCLMEAYHCKAFWLNEGLTIAIVAVHYTMIGLETELLALMLWNPKTLFRFSKPKNAQKLLSKFFLPLLVNLLTPNLLLLLFTLFTNFQHLHRISNCFFFFFFNVFNVFWDRLLCFCSFSCCTLQLLVMYKWEWNLSWQGKAKSFLAESLCSSIIISVILIWNQRRFEWCSINVLLRKKIPLSTTYLCVSYHLLQL